MIEHTYGRLIIGEVAAFTVEAIALRSRSLLGFVREQLPVRFIPTVTHEDK